MGKFFDEGDTITAGGEGADTLSFTDKHQTTTQQRSLDKIADHRCWER